jgi:uncharacterized membrane protein
MAKKARRAPRRSLIGPLVMLAGGVAASLVLWRGLMGEAPADSRRAADEVLTAHDQQALQRILEERSSHR